MLKRPILQKALIGVFLRNLLFLEPILKIQSWVLRCGTNVEENVEKNKCINFDHIIEEYIKDNHIKWILKNLIYEL